MNKLLCICFTLFFVFSLLFFSCDNHLKINKEDDEKQNVETPSDDSQTVKMNSFFWGTWVRMDNGKEYEFLESSVEQAAKKYVVETSNENSISVSELGTFTKESDSVIVCDNIPYFRKGGINLEYSLKLVGFESSIRQAERAAGSVVGGYKGKRKIKKIYNF